MSKKFVHYFPPVSDTLEEVREKTTFLFKKFGYKLVEPSTFEDYEKSKNLNGSNTIKFMDSDGTIIALRNEFTPKVAEIAAKFQTKVYPLKLCYFGKAYQFLQQEAGDLREFFQAGIENFHTSDSFYIDLEVLALAVESLLELGVNNFTIDVGEVNFFKGIAKDCEIDETSSEVLCKLVDKKDYIGIENFLIRKGISPKVIDIFRNLTRLYGREDKIKEAKRFANNEISKMAIERLSEIYNNMVKLGYQNYITIDFGMVKHLNYYTGIIFSGYIQELGYPILNGGRYDNLCEIFGTKLYAIGFAIGADRILEWKLKNTQRNERQYNSLVLYKEGHFETALKLLLKTDNEKQKIYFYPVPAKIEEAFLISKTMKVEEFMYVDEEGVKTYVLEDLE
ncbi:ATP phosphoribosyltransferase regulatory subunit [Anaerocellum diazotrophicum]|uniref:ATP phosphoribosyltransferase regulatory subunit n=1 Tax=Caldicellulosiruptor diazotrophicus TaxID=2806205 RepID=A0ABN6E6Q4_9FIRM|nr:ATP phosphoribosyltransferase regulatory subunit [Caldicellulosiruptor diazotrophicus]BCS81078.1 ATP phosphoribosyltransferase regulatory subunit [Caldicellulosiruptor diazotrophicus]